MKPHLLLISFIAFCALLLFGNDDDQLKITRFKPPIKIKTTLVKCNDTDIMVNLSSQIALVLIDSLPDSIFNDLITKTRRISFGISLDWNGNVFFIINRSIEIPNSISNLIMSKIERNKFDIPLNGYVLNEVANKTCEYLDKVRYFMPLTFDPRYQMSYYSKSPYFLKEVPDSVITKEAIMKLSKEILATPLKINHDFDSLMNINPQKRNNYNQKNRIGEYNGMEKIALNINTGAYSNLTSNTGFFNTSFDKQYLKSGIEFQTYNQLNNIGNPSYKKAITKVPSLILNLIYKSTK